MIDLEKAAEALKTEALDGWLLYDFQNINPLARQAVLNIEGMLTRRWFCLIRPDGGPVWLVHAIEAATFEGVPGEVRTYARRDELSERLGALLTGARRIAMEYSPCANIPYVSRVDAGTIELVRTTGVEVVSSGDLVQKLLAPWPEGGLAAHRRAARVLEAAVHSAWDAIGSRLAGDDPMTECEVQGELLNAIDQAGLETGHSPIVAVGAHAADPHFSPEPARDRSIGRDEALMIDIWAREPGPQGVYADMTFMAFTGAKAPARLLEVWDCVRRGRDAALTLIQERFEADQPLKGYEVDRAARDVIERAGFGHAFVHRTGHSLGPEDHWIGANMDDYETRDERRLLPGTGFTVEPGIYLPGELGVRSEVDIFWGDAGPEVTTEIQTELRLITA